MYKRKVNIGMVAEMTTRSMIRSKWQTYLLIRLEIYFSLQLMFSLGASFLPDHHPCLHLEVDW